jgi:hypothetical protein
LGDGVPQLVQLERPDDRSDDLHDVHVAMQRALLVSIAYLAKRVEPSGSAPTGPVQKLCHWSHAG